MKNIIQTHRKRDYLLTVITEDVREVNLLICDYKSKIMEGIKGCNLIDFQLAPLSIDESVLLRKELGYSKANWIKEYIRK